MKKTISILGSIFLLLTLVFNIGCGSGEKYTDPVEYNDAIIDELTTVDSYFTTLDSIAGEDDFDYTAYEKTREEAISKIAECEDAINDIGTFESDDALQKAALDYLEKAKNQFEGDWKIIGEKFNDIDNLSDEEVDNLIDLISSAYNKYDDLSVDFSDIQDKFSEDHNYEIE